MKKTFSKESVRGTEVNVLIIGKIINEEIESNNFNEKIKEGLEFILKEFDISYDIILSKDEIIQKCKNNRYDIIFLEHNLMEDNREKKDLSELIDIIRKNNEGNNSLIIGLMNGEDKNFRKILNENDVELVLYKPVKKGQIVVILRNDFKWEVN